MTEYGSKKETLRFTPNSKIVMFGLPGSGKTSLLEALAKASWSDDQNSPRTLVPYFSGEHPFDCFSRATPLMHVEHRLDGEPSDVELSRVTHSILTADTYLKNPGSIQIQIDHKIQVSDPAGDVCVKILTTTPDSGQLSTAEDLYTRELQEANTVVCALPLDIDSNLGEEQIPAKIHLEYLKAILDGMGNGEKPHIIVALTKSDYYPNLEQSPRRLFDITYLHAGQDLMIGGYDKFHELYPQVEFEVTSAAGFFPKRGNMGEHYRPNYDHLRRCVENPDLWKPRGVMQILHSHLNNVEEEMLEASIRQRPLRHLDLRYRKKIQKNYKPF